MRKNPVKKSLALLLALVMLTTALTVPSFAAENVYTHMNGEKYILERVSNPDKGEGEIDGLAPEGDRTSGYCWAMAENNGYVYIGTWSNGLYQIVLSISQLSQSGISQDVVDKLMLAYTNGEIDPCEENSTQRAKIYRYSEATGEMELLFDPADYESGDYSAIYGFRAATTFKGDVYMDAMLNTGATDCQLWRVNEEDPYATPELCLENGSLRALCVSVDEERMYTGGSCEIPEGYKSGCVVFSTDTGDYGDFDTIADSTDFEYYTRNGASITVNDVIAFPNDKYENGEEVIASLITSFGVAVFRGHVASEEEKAAGLANEYGWVWSEFIGVNADYPISLGNKLNVTLTPAVFDGELYFLSMTNPMTPLMTAFMGILAQNTTYLYAGIDQLAATLDSECAVYRYTSDGRMQMVMGDKEFCPDSVEYVAKLGAGFNDDQYSTSMYAWRSVTYNGRMYVNTIDVWNMYGYFTKITNGQLLGMNKEDFKSQIDYIADFVSAAATEILGEQSALGKIVSALGKYGDFINSSEILSKLADNMTEPAFDALYSIYSTLDQKATTESLSNIIDYSVKFSEQLNNLKLKIEQRINEGYYNPENCEAAKAAVDYINQLNKPFQYIAENKTHIENYMLISDVCANHTSPGGEVWCTENGVDWEPITINGFNDKYNHGIRTFALGDDGSFYMGTANPYYGAQLWKLTDETVTVAEETEPTEDSAPAEVETDTAEPEAPADTGGEATAEEGGILQWIQNLFSRLFKR